MAEKPPRKHTMTPEWAETLEQWRSESGPKLRQLFRSKVNSLYDANDLENDVVLNMARHSAPEQIGDLDAYAYKVARNTLYRKFNERRSAKKALQEINLRYPEVLMGSPPVSPEEAAAQLQKLTLMNKALEPLSDKDKLVLEHWRAGRTVAKISEMTGMTVPTVATHLYRAKIRIKQALIQIRDNRPPDTEE
jgi:RNA polymerase sigma factor (sigma-70 family)